MNSAIAHYCQKCRFANQIGERNCRACGTRLMLVVFPPSIRHDDSVTPSFYEDHLLERVSLLELHLAQAVEKITMISEVFAREAKDLRREQSFVRAFADALKRENPRLAQRLLEKYERGGQIETHHKNASLKREQTLKEIVARHDNSNAPLFARLLEEAVRLLDGGEEKQAFQMLERAVLLSPQNRSLLVFTAENYYRADKTKDAKAHLERAFEIAPDDGKVLLLLGAIGADAGRGDEARRFLSVLANDNEVSVLIHFIWGMLAADEENWTESLAAFKQAAASEGEDDAPAEINYLIGSVYFELKRFESALSYFQKVAAADFKFSDARQMQNLIHAILEENKTASELFDSPAPKTGGAVDLDVFTGIKSGNAAAAKQTALAFRHFKEERKNLLTGGSPRLKRFFRERIFRAIE